MTRRTRPPGLVDLAGQSPASAAAVARLDERIIGLIDRYDRDQAAASQQREGMANRIEKLETSLKPIQQLQEKQKAAWWLIGALLTLLVGASAFIEKIVVWLQK